MMDASNDAIAARQLASAVVSIKCSRCGGGQALTREGLIHKFDAFLKKNLTSDMSFLFVCDSCGASTCFGCGKGVQPSGLPQNGYTTKDKPFAWHCDEGRLALVWFLLCGYVNQINRSEVTTGARLSSANQSEATTAGMIPAGVGYGVGSEIEAEDDPSDDEDHPSDDESERLDEPTAYAMAAIAACLPDRGRKDQTNFDRTPPAALSSLLLRSSILDKAAELLRNESLEGATKRFELYQSLFAFVTALAECGGDLARATLYKARAKNKPGRDLLELSFGLETRSKNELTGESEESTPAIVECMANLISQRETMMKFVQMNPRAFKGADTKRLIELCVHIAECVKLFPTSTTPTNNEKSMKHTSTATSAKTDKHGWQQEHTVCEVADHVILEEHRFASDARAAACPPTGRMRRLASELVTLKTSKLHGIFVRHGETRLDVMKVLIVGPQGTPYENGLFEFDLFCPQDYPNSPPQMHFKTTGGGTEDFNPNLYHDGTVCLSLLGTYPRGEQWMPGKSTIFQVALSIQAMVFCDEPICNEPGHEELYGTDSSMRYNRRQHAPVVEFAMLEWLEGKKKLTPEQSRDGPGRTSGVRSEGDMDKAETGDNEGMWAAIVKNHFETNHEEIIECVRKWINDKPEMKPSKKKRKQTQNFAGLLNTESVGKVPDGGESDTGPAKPSRTKFDASILDKNQDLISKLKAMLPELE